MPSTAYIGHGEGEVDKEQDLASHLEDRQAKQSALRRSAEEVSQRRKLFRDTDLNDPSVAVEDVQRIEGALDNENSSTESDLTGQIVEDPPYPEVSGTVRDYDIDVPANTIRAWVIGLLMTTVFSAVNVLFFLRQPSIYINSYVAQLVAYPLGLGWAKFMPNYQFKLLNINFSLNPGPWNIKEHTVIALMANASYGGGAAYFTDILVTQKKFYGFDLGPGYAILLGLTTSLMGFGLAGVCRRFLVDPLSMTWPKILVNCAFMYTLHDHDRTKAAQANGWSIGRFRWFLLVFCGSFCWYWFPGFLFQALGAFVFPTFIAPQNPTVNQVFGGWTGMALLPITFDWTQISGYAGSPLIPPAHAIANTMIGIVVFFIITASAIHWTNAWYGHFVPFSDGTSWDNTQHHYDVSRILTPQFTLDEEKYKQYSPLFLSTTFALGNGLAFAFIAALIIHTALYHGKELWMRVRDREHSLDDIHSRMMRKYKRVPEWWFAVIFLITVALTFVTAYVWRETELTWWAIIVAVLIAAIMMIPIGIIQAVTNIQLGLNIFTEFVIGYMLPGKPTALMMFKTYGYISMWQAVNFSSDMKFGHYLKIPPRITFSAQVIATFWSVLVQIAVVYWAMGSLKDVCTPNAVAKFTCPTARAFFTTSVIWGAIGPQRIFSPGKLYVDVQYFWLLGAALPVCLWLIRRKRPNSFVRHLSAPIILGGAAFIPPATPLNYLSWGIVGLVFNKYIRDRYRGWWLRFNYITSAALDSGLIVCTLVIVLTLGLTNTQPPSWWGNNIATSTLDATDTAFIQKLKPGETFGPSTW